VFELKRRFLRAVVSSAAPFILGGCATVMHTVRPGSSRAELRHTIDSLTSQSEFRNAHWGVLIVNPRTGDTVYSKNAGKLFMPASNMKIITSAVALTLLGPDYTYKTTFLADGRCAIRFSTESHRHRARRSDDQRQHAPPRHDGHGHAR
jgi:D-alanyl-D-alanine carboxypeptidase/D-alanyl-D-alanine-endopeptidase (penicillin-binding protein 4)